MSERAGWSRVDASLASALEARRLIPPGELARLHGLGRQHGVERGGSFLAGALVRAGVLRPEAVDELLGQVVAQLAAGSTTGTSSRIQPSLGATVVRAPTGGGETQATRASPATDAPTIVPTASGRLPVAAPPSPALEAIFGGERYEAREPLDLDRRLVLDRRLGRPVVLVEGRAPAPGTPPDISFLREALALVRLDHPAVPKVHDVASGLGGGRAYYTTDWLEGDSLSRVLARPEGERPSLPQLLRAFLAVSAAVSHAHERRLAHGALSPEHVVLGSRGRVWLGGWGRANALAGASTVVARAVALPLPVVGAPPLRAPECRDGRAPDERSDVWGLGVLLHWILVRRAPGARGALRGARGLPRELNAIATMALAGRPEERYARVLDVTEDVRRFLDGRSVLAERDSLVRATARLARRHPEVGVIVSVLAGTVAIVVALALRDLRAIHARAAEARAFAARARVEVAGRQAASADSDTDTARVLATAEDLGRFDEALAAIARERALAALDHGADARVEAALDRARELETRLLARARQSLDAARTRSDRDERRALLDEAEHSARGRLAWARAGWALASRRPSPESALADLDLVLTLPRTTDAERARAQLGRFLAARRLEGSEPRAADAMRKLALLDDPLAELGRLYPAYAAAWARTADPLALYAANAPESTPESVALRERATRLAAERPDLPFAHELLAALEAGDPSRNGGGGAGESLVASYLDANDPFPVVLRERAFVRTAALHAVWRWIAGTTFSKLDTRLPPDPRPGDRSVPAQAPFLDYVRYLELVGRKPAALGYAARQLRSLAGLTAPERRGRSPWVTAQLACARGRLASGLDPGDELEGLEVPPELESERNVLLAWRALTKERGTSSRGIELLAATIQQPRTQLANSDLMDLLRDRTIDPPVLVSVLDQFLPPRRAGEGGEVLGLLARRALAKGRAGVAPGQDLERIDAILGRGPEGRARDVDALLAQGGVFQLELGLCQLARLRERGRTSDDPRAHTGLLQLGAGVNFEFDSTEDVANEARDAIVERLRRLGHEDAARAFAELDPVDEVFVRRDWTPRGAHVWRKAGP